MPRYEKFCRTLPSTTCSFAVNQRHSYCCVDPPNEIPYVPPTTCVGPCSGGKAIRSPAMIGSTQAIGYHEYGQAPR